MIGKPLLTLALLSTAGHAHAAKRVTQTVTSQKDKDTLTETHTWTIEGSQFSLEAKLPDRNISYIFNGRNLYACLKVTAASFKFDAKTKEQESYLREKLQNGVCFIAPVNIATSFFISPHNSISALDITDSLELTLSLDKYDSKNENGSAPDCRGATRAFEYDYFAYTAGKELTNQATESYCSSDKINWRKPMWHQLSRTLLQQKAGRKLRKQVKDLKLDALGLSIQKEASYDILDKNNSLRKIAVNVKTSKVEDLKADPRSFRIPLGFEPLTSSKKREAIAVSSQQSGGGKGQSKTSGSQKGRADDTEEDSILPQILRTFIGLPF